MVSLYAVAVTVLENVKKHTAAARCEPAAVLPAPFHTASRCVDLLDVASSRLFGCAFVTADR